LVSQTYGAEEKEGVAWGWKHHVIGGGSCFELLAQYYEDIEVGWAHETQWTEGRSAYEVLVENP
jgi:hypothetical protein